MLGFHLTAYSWGHPALRGSRGTLEVMRALLARTTGSDEIPSSTDADVRLAVWQSGLGGTGWLDGLVEDGQAAKTSRGGYPDTFLVRFEELRGQLDRGLLILGKPWMTAPGDILLDGYVGTDTAFPEALAAMDPADWVLIQVWDES